MPPSALPLAARYCHFTAPCSSRSNAQPTPDFCPPAPECPQRVVPIECLTIGFASAPIVYVCRSSEPLDASSATRLPRNVQHSYFALLPCPSSPDATGTYKRFSNSVGAPVTRALAC